MPDNSKPWELITNNRMNILILFSLIFAGIFIKIFITGNNSANNGQASSTIWGYGLTTISLFTLMFIILSNKKDEDPFKQLLNSGLPIFILILILIYIRILILI